MNNLTVFPLIASLLVLLFSCGSEDEPALYEEPNTLKQSEAVVDVSSIDKPTNGHYHLYIRLNHKFNTEELVSLPDQHKYNDTTFFRPKTFQYYFSNIKLIDGESVFSEKSSYRLIDAVNTVKAGILVENIPNSINPSFLQFALGIDSATNYSLDDDGTSFSPTQGMYWVWKTGYKYIIIEGDLVRADTNISRDGLVVMHVGEDENYNEYQFDLSKLNNISFSDGILVVDIDVDLEKAFSSTHLLNIWNYNDAMCCEQADTIAQNLAYDFFILTNASFQQ